MILAPTRISRLGRPRVVAGGAFEVEPDGDQVLRHQLARAAGDRRRDRRAVDAAVLRALHAHRALQAEAARLEVEQRLRLVEAHQELGAGAGGRAHLDAARGIGGGEERLRPGRVVAVDEGAFRAVDRDGLGVGGEARHGDLQLLGLLAGALEERAPAADRGADRAGERVRPGVARRRASSSRSRRSRAPTAIAASAASCSGIVLGVGHVRLVAGRAARAHLRIGEGDLQRREVADHLGELGRRQAVREPHELGARDVHVDERGARARAPGSPSPRARPSGSRW